MRDVNLREVIVVAPLLALSLFLGLYPKAALDRIEPSVKRAVSNLERKSDYREPKPPGFAKDIEGAMRSEERQVIAVVNDIATPHVDWLAIAPELSLARRRRADRAAAGRSSGDGRAPRWPPSSWPAAGVLAAGGTLVWQWFHVRDDGADHARWRAWCASTASACTSGSSSSSRPRSRCWCRSPTCVASSSRHPSTSPCCSSPASAWSS